MDINSFKIQFEESNAPLKMFPKDTWVSIEDFHAPCRVLEISLQRIILDTENHKKINFFNENDKICLHFLGFPKEKHFEIHVRISKIDHKKCQCEILHDINSEEKTLDKVILEIQKKEIANKHSADDELNHKYGNHHANHEHSATTDADIAPILNNLIAMLPDETGDNSEEKVIAHTLTDIPKSSFEYHAPIDPVKLFEQLTGGQADDFEEDFETMQSENDENGQDNNPINQEDIVHQIDSEILKVCNSVHELALLRYSIVHKFLLEDFPDPYAHDTKILEEHHINPDEITQIQEVLANPEEHNQEKAGAERKKNAESHPQVSGRKSGSRSAKTAGSAKRIKKKASQDIADFIPANLIAEMNMPNFMANIEKTNEYHFNLVDTAKHIDRDALFENYYKFSEELSPELLSKLLNEMIKNGKITPEECKELAPHLMSNEFSFILLDEEDVECFDDDPDCQELKRFSKPESKKTIEFNINNDPDFVPRSREDQDQEFFEKTINKIEEKITEKEEKKHYQFNLNLD